MWEVLSFESTDFLEADDLDESREEQEDLDKLETFNVSKIYEWNLRFNLSLKFLLFYC